MKDASKRATPGVHGVVINTKLFEKHVRRSRADDRKKILNYQKKAREEKTVLLGARDSKIIELMKSQISSGIKDRSSGRTLIKKGTKLTIKRLKTYDLACKQKNNFFEET